MIEYYQERLRVIEGIFGENWLLNKSGKRGSRQKPPRHPAQKLWAAAQKALKIVGDPLHPDDLNVLADIEDLASTLEVVSKLDGFHELMLPKLTDKRSPSDYASFLYEASIAAWHAKLGQQVQFIPTVNERGIKTPDIGICMNRDMVRIECKQKDRVRPLSLSPEKRANVDDRMRAILDDAMRNFDLMLFLQGEPSTEALNTAFSKVKDVVESGGRGLQSVPEAGVWFLVRDRPPPPAHPVTAITNLPYDAPGAASYYYLSARVKRDEQGMMLVGYWKTGYLFHFDSHAFKQLNYSFNEGKRQFSHGESGCVYIDLDPVDMNGPTLAWYVTLMGYALADLAWRGGQNTRIGVIALTAGPIREDALLKGQNARLNTHFHFYKTAPHLSAENSLYKVFDQVRRKMLADNAWQTP